MEAHRNIQTPHTRDYDVSILDTYSKAIELDSNDYLSYLERGSCVIVEEQYIRRSISDLKKFIELAPKDHVEICSSCYMIGCNLSLLPG